MCSSLGAWLSGRAARCLPTLAAHCCCWRRCLKHTGSESSQARTCCRLHASYCCSLCSPPGKVPSTSKLVWAVGQAVGKQGYFLCTSVGAAPRCDAQAPSSERHQLLSTLGDYTMSCLEHEQAAHERDTGPIGNVCSRDRGRCAQALNGVNRTARTTRSSAYICKQLLTGSSNYEQQVSVGTKG